MKKLILMILIPILLVSCSTDTLDWLYDLTSMGKENVLFHGDLEKLSDGVLDMSRSTPYQEDRSFSSVRITASGMDGAIIGSFTAGEDALLYSLVIASQNQRKCEAIREKIAQPVTEERLNNACSVSLEFYNSLISGMQDYLSGVEGDYALLIGRVLSGFRIDQEITGFTYRDVIAFKVLNSLVTAFLSIPGFPTGEEYTPSALAEAVLAVTLEDGSELNAYIARVTAALGEARNVTRTIGDGPVLSASAVASILDVLLEGLG